MNGLSIAISVILFIIIIIIIIYAVKKKNTDVAWPPPSYMNKIGGKCPDYWTYLGEDHEDRTVCKNIYNVPITKLDTQHKCMTESTNIRKFKNYTTWPPKEEALYERCRWIQGCGERPQLQGSWIGMDTLCSAEGDIPEPPKYSCDGTTCFPSPDGTYNNYDECQLTCPGPSPHPPSPSPHPPSPSPHPPSPSPSPTLKYSCQSGSCKIDPTGQSLEDCHKQCILHPLPAKYSCMSDSSTGKKNCGRHPNGKPLNECQSSCIKNYKCEKGECIIDETNGTMTLDTCKSTCNPPSPSPHPPSPSPGHGPSQPKCVMNL